MLRLVLIASLAVAAFGARLPSPHFPSGGRIVGGEDASIQEVPYQAALMYSGFLVCGASVLSANVAVSAGHCVFDEAMYYKVRAGTDQDTAGSGQTVDVSRIILHEDYDDWEIDYDISLFFLASPLTLGATIVPIALPAQGQSVATGALALASGWGSLAENGNYPITLQKVSIPIIAQATCVSNYNTLGWLVSDRMICAGLTEGGKDACQGDSGGPLVIDGQLIGITSWGNGCARRGYPGVWARVPFFINWINANAGL